MRRGGFGILGWKSVLATVSIGVGVWLAASAVIPARAAPPPGAGNTVTVANTPLPVTGTVTIAGTTTVSGSVAASPGLPANPFSSTVSIFPDRETPVVVGPFTGTLGLGSIGVTNFDSSATVQVHISAVVVSGGTSCETATVLGGATPELDVLVPPRQTLQLPYPTPFVFAPLTGGTCVGVSVTSLRSSLVEVFLTGSVQ